MSRPLFSDLGDDDVADESEDEETLAETQRLRSRRRNRILLEGLLGIMEESEERMVRYVLDQSYRESTVPNTLDMERKLDISTVKYSDSEKRFESCQICQEDFLDEDVLGTIECDHYFHNACLQEWGKRKPTCPFCEQDLPVAAELPPNKRQREE